MRLDCPACQSSYEIDRAEIGAGRAVICAHCTTQWFVRAETRRQPGGDLKAEAVSGRIGASAPPTLAIPNALRVPRWTLVGVATSCFAIIALVAGRGTIVRTIPRTAALYALAGQPVNLRGLDFDGVRSIGTTAGDVTVSGTIRNVAMRRVRVPNLRYEARDGSGIALVSWRERAATRNLSAGRSLVFASLPHRLPAAARTVLVAFEDADEGPGDLAMAAPRR